MISKFNKKELANFLGIKSESLKMIEKRGRLLERLMEKGCRLISREITGEIGRQQTIYTIEQCEDTSLDEMLEILMGKKKHKDMAHKIAYTRLKYAEEAIDINELANQLCEDQSSIDNVYKGSLIRYIQRSWKGMEDRNVIEKDKILYFRIYNKSGRLEKSDYIEYKKYQQMIMQIKDNIAQMNISGQNEGDLKRWTDNLISYIKGYSYLRVQTYKITETFEVFADNYCKAIEQIHSIVDGINHDRLLLNKKVMIQAYEEMKLVEAIKAGEDIDV